MDAHFRSFAHLVLPYLVEHGIGVLGMKTFGDGVILKSDAPIRPVEYLHYSLNPPTSVVITGIGSPRDLDQAFEAARTFAPMDRAAMAELLERSRPYAERGKYELVKTSATFDGTAKNAKWLGDEVEGVQQLAPTLEWESGNPGVARPRSPCGSMIFDSHCRSVVSEGPQMSDLQTPRFEANPASLVYPLVGDTVRSIALRTLWSPASISERELQILAASIIAHIRQGEVDKLPSVN